MKLQKKYQIGLLKTITVLSLPFIVVLYLLINYLTQDEVRELLEFQSEKITNSIREGNQLSSIPPTIIISEAQETKAAVSYGKVFVYDELANETEEYYELRNIRLIGGKFYEIIVRSTAVERLDLFLSIFFSTLGLLLILGFSLFYLNDNIFRKLLEPFKKTLKSLQGFSIHEGNAIEYSPSNIDEFDELAKVVTALSTKVSNDYQSLKQFTENASHEMQTPLAIIKNKIEQIINVPGLSTQLSQDIIGIDEAADKLANLNKGLLLLTKIDNRQFSVVELVNFGACISHELGFISDLQEDDETGMKVQENNRFLHTINPILAEILVRNLIKNILIHSDSPKGSRIVIEAENISFINQGGAALADDGLLFSRFHKNSENETSLGLGLAIAKAICDQAQLALSYHFIDSNHQFRISKSSI